MGYEYHIIAPAINRALVLRRELLRAYSAAGVNITKVIQESVKLNLSLDKTKIAFKAIYSSVASRFFGALTQQSENLRKRIYANMPKILSAIEAFVKFIFKASAALNQLGERLFSILSRVYKFFVGLDEQTHGWSTAILAFAAAWEFLNLQFLATPLGLIITGLVAILALFDDFKTWQEGGKSLFNWSSFVPVINSVADALKSMWGVLNSIAEVIADVAFGLYQLVKGNTSGFFDQMALAGQHLVQVFSGLWDVIKGVVGSVVQLGGWLTGTANALIGFSASKTNPGDSFIPTPTHPHGSYGNNQTNQNVQQQTNINVVGSADAQAVGKQVASEQTRVNFDMTRNMRGATR